MNSEQTKRIQDHLSHLADLHQASIRLGMKLIEDGEIDFGRILMANCFKHDHSKFFGVEWDVIVLRNRPELLALAVEQHNHSNPHHPEYWGSIHNMDDVHLAEMVCDWKARSSKFGTSLKDWINSEAMDRYKFKRSDEVYDKIMRFVSMILDEPYKRLQ